MKEIESLYRLVHQWRKKSDAVLDKASDDSSCCEKTALRWQAYMLEDCANELEEVMRRNGIV